MDGSSPYSASAAASASSPAPRPNNSFRPDSSLGPPLPLNERASSRNALRDAFTLGDVSPPSTPRNNTRRLRKGKEAVRGQSRRQENSTVEPSAVPAYNPRHSHGLSWSSTTRDSVVDNLLSSLDELSLQMKGTFDSVRSDRYDDERQREQDRIRQAPLHAMNSRTAQRARGHTYTSSLSSDYDRQTVPDSPSSKFSSPPQQRSRRSNSSSNYVPNPGTSRPKPPTSRFSDRKGRASNDAQHSHKASTLRSSRPHGHDREDSESSLASLANSVDLASPRLAWAGRSVSMDHIFAEANGGASILSRGRPVPSVHSSYESARDAAPEPMIPAGPRKLQNPTATGPVYVGQASKQSALRKMTTQSDLRSSSNPTIPQDIRNAASEFVRANSMRGDGPVPNVPEKPASGGPPGSVSGGRRKEASSPQRERPGFFKRVFGSASRASDLPHQSQEPARNLSSSGSNLRYESGQAPSRPTTNSAPPLASLNKKPSSFFRRRKKSISDNTPRPALPAHLGNADKGPTQPSPSASSLRQAMDPYIGNEVPETPKGIHDENSRPTTGTDSDDLDMFHSGYTPPPDATLGRRDPFSREPAGKTRMNSDAEKMKLKVKRKPDSIPTISTTRPSGSSFLRDASAEKADPVSPLLFYSPTESSAPKVSPVSSSSPVSAQDPAKEPEKPTLSRTSTGDRIIGSLGNSPVGPEQEVRDFPARHNMNLDMHDHSDQSWLVTHDAQNAKDRPAANAPERLFLQPSESEEEKEEIYDDVSPNLPPSHKASISASMHTPAASAVHTPATPSTRYHSASSLPLVQVDGNDAPRPSVDTIGQRANAKTEEEEVRERAQRIFDGDEEDLTRMEAAAWLGELKSLNKRTLDAYIDLFDFAGMNILAALRALCGKLVLKGETQQFDRIITALSARWCQCNPNHGFKAQDVVHTVFYSVILLNTDLHMADIGDKMSKSAYVKNTLPTIRRVVSDAAPNAFDETIKPASANQSRPSLPWPDPNASAPSSPALPPDTPQERTSFEGGRLPLSKRHSIRPGMFRTELEGLTQDSPNSSSSNTLVSGPWTGSMRGWENEIETMLKSFWTSIRTEPLPLLNLSVNDAPIGDRNLSVTNLRRSGSVVSKAPSEAFSYRSKPGFRNLAMGWQGRSNRSRPKLYPASTTGSSRTSLDDGSSMWSPANSNGRTLTSASVQSLGHQASPLDSSFKHSIGFANALSQAIIREEGGNNSNGNNAESDSITLKGDLLEDESLTLEGAPWAKEGMVKHKHHWEGPERKAKDRNWSECFAVISKGKLTLFNFNTGGGGRSLGRQRLQKLGGGRASSLAAPRVGGGDWMENAEQLETFVLRQTIASTLPPPGYSKARPNVWALSLPSGACHLFQVGTPELSAEWTSTANYWSARLSKEPLSGGVSNIEYGWSDQVINPALLERSESFSSPPPAIMNRQRTHTHSSSSGAMPRPSTQSSLRSSFDIGGGNSRSRMPGDKIQITDWQQPSQSMMASQLMEVDQLKALNAYVSNVEAELETHNELKHAIELAVSPDTPLSPFS